MINLSNLKVSTWGNIGHCGMYYTFTQISYSGLPSIHIKEFKANEEAFKVALEGSIISTYLKTYPHHDMRLLYVCDMRPCDMRLYGRGPIKSICMVSLLSLSSMECAVHALLQKF